MAELDALGCNVIARHSNSYHDGNNDDNLRISKNSTALLLGRLSVSFSLDRATIGPLNCSGKSERHRNRNKKEHRDRNREIGTRIETERGTGASRDILCYITSMLSDSYLESPKRTIPHNSKQSLQMQISDCYTGH